jgi:hypothetical protein
VASSRSTLNARQTKPKLKRVQKITFAAFGVNVFKTEQTIVL